MRPLILAIVLAACSPPIELELEQGRERAGGAATVFDVRSSAYSHAFVDLDRDTERAFYRGKAFFEDPWVAAPASTESRDGLGPIFNARTCVDCHVRRGRGGPPVTGEAMHSMLIRVSAIDAEGHAKPHPVYGDQIQPSGIPGVPGEGSATISYREVSGLFADGSSYSLRAPIYDFRELAYGELDSDSMFSARTAPPLVGSGLLEAISDETLEALADPDDKDGDGISGRPRYIEQETMRFVGRFGWKGGNATLVGQTAGAFAADIGLTSALAPRESCTAFEEECARAPSGGEPELLEVIVEETALFMRTSAVPARRDWGLPTVLRGEEIFSEAGCQGCHIPKLITGIVANPPQLSEQVIRPYTDLLLHDMGDELADGRPEGDASGREWRTPALWGLGLSAIVNGHSTLLHDGRARDVAEAILWHGGEAAAARDAFLSLSAADRDLLIRFVESL